MSSICPDPQDAAGRTRIIAHRGACGYLPEHTAVAKVLAYGLGADFIEQDLIATSDQQLVVLHDIYLDDVSDVATRFAARRRADGHFYVVDFTLAEINEITLVERRTPGSDSPRFPARFPYELGAFKVSRFEDEIRLVSGLNVSTGRHVGLYPEIKDPVWHREAGIDLTKLVHDALEANRHIMSGPVFLQSFDAPTINRLKDEFATPFQLVQLLNRQDAARLASDRAALDHLTEYVAGVGLPYETLIEPDLIDGKPQATALARRLTETGLLVHPYTMRRDVAPPGQAGYRDVLRFLIHELRVDALFCDFPDDALAVRDCSVV